MHGARIDIEGFMLNDEERKHLDNAIKAISQFSVDNIGFKLIKSKRVYEGLAWCNIAGVPFGLYLKGIQPRNVIDQFHRKVIKEYKKRRKNAVFELKPKQNSQAPNKFNVELAG